MLLHFALKKALTCISEMIIDATKLEGSESEFSFKIEGDKIDVGEDLKILKPLLISGKIKKGAAETRIGGNVKTAVRTECSRCLRDIEKEIDTSFSSSFVDPENFSAQSEKELSQDEMDISVGSAAEIDLAELAREQILLALPAQNFCSVDCKGLCAVCGGNKNLIDCNCEESRTDPRWSALKDLIR